MSSVLVDHIANNYSYISTSICLVTTNIDCRPLCAYMKQQVTVNSLLLDHVNQRELIGFGFRSCRTYLMSVAVECLLNSHYET